MAQWYYTQQGQRLGPVSEEQLKQLAAAAQLKPTDMVWKHGMANWIHASQVKGLFPPSGPPDPQMSSASSRRPETAAQPLPHVKEDTGKSGPVYAVVRSIDRRVPRMG